MLVTICTLPGSWSATSSTITGPWTGAGSWTHTGAGALCSLMADKWGHTFLLGVKRACTSMCPLLLHVGKWLMQVYQEESGHCEAPAAAGNGVLKTLVAADRPGEPVRGPKAVEAGKAEIPSTHRGSKVSLSTLCPWCHIHSSLIQNRYSGSKL